MKIFKILSIALILIVQIQTAHAQPLLETSFESTLSKEVLENLTYDVTDMSGKVLKGQFKNGIYENGKFGDKGYLRSNIKYITFGQIDNDQTDDALVIIESAIYDSLPKNYDFYIIVNAASGLKSFKLTSGILKVGSIVSSAIIDGKTYLRYVGYDKGDSPETPTKDVAYTLSLENDLITARQITTANYESICGEISLKYLESKIDKPIHIFEEGPLLSKIISIVGQERARRIPELTEGPAISLQKEGNILSFANCKKPCITYSLSVFIDISDNSVDLGWIDENCAKTGAKNYIFSSNHPPKKVNYCLECFGKELSCFKK